MQFTRKTRNEICLTMFLCVQFSIIIGLIKQCLWVFLTRFMLHQRWGSGLNTWWSCCCCCCHLIITLQSKSYLPFAFSALHYWQFLHGEICCDANVSLLEFNCFTWNYHGGCRWWGGGAFLRQLHTCSERDWRNETGLDSEQQGLL